MFSNLYEVQIQLTQCNMYQTLDLQPFPSHMAILEDVQHINQQNLMVSNLLYAKLMF